jgi:hypothetical protein
MAILGRPPQPERYTRLVGGTIDLTIVYENGDDNWIVASIPAVPGALSQGRTRQEARKNVLATLARISAMAHSLPLGFRAWTRSTS